MTGGFSKLRGDVPLAVYIDLKSPYAYLAIDPTREMAAAAGVPIDWRPFTLDIPSYLGSARLDKKGKVASANRTTQQWSGVKYAYRDARRYANLSGKTVRGTEKIWDSSLAGIAMLWAKRQGGDCFDRFIDDAYPRFWRRDLDIEDLAVLDNLGRALECPDLGDSSDVATIPFHPELEVLVGIEALGINTELSHLRSPLRFMPGPVRPAAGSG